MHATSSIRQERRPAPSSHQNADPDPSEYLLTCTFTIPRRVETEFCPPRVRAYRVAQASALRVPCARPRKSSGVPLSPILRRLYVRRSLGGIVLRGHCAAPR